MKMGNVVLGPLFPVSSPQLQCWKNCARGKSKGCIKGEGKHFSSIAMFKTYFLSTSLLSKIVASFSVYLGISSVSAQVSLSYSLIASNLKLSCCERSSKSHSFPSLHGTLCCDFLSQFC